MARAARGTATPARATGDCRRPEASSKRAFIEGGGSSAVPVTSACGRGRRVVAESAMKFLDRARACRNQSFTGHAICASARKIFSTLISVCFSRGCEGCHGGPWGRFGVRGESRRKSGGPKRFGWSRCLSPNCLSPKWLCLMCLCRLRGATPHGYHGYHRDLLFVCRSEERKRATRRSLNRLPPCTPEFCSHPDTTKPAALLLTH
jgi:hypothetical protein